MRIAVLSDVHGNLPALEAVLRDTADCDALWNLGDTVGYGPDPARCMDLLAARAPRVTLVGNHDLACIGQLDTSLFNLVARQATDWTAKQLDDEHRQTLASYPPTAVAADATLAHGSPRSPIWEYVISAEIATDNMSAFATQLCFVGHTHVAAVATTSGDSSRIRFRRLAGGSGVDVASDRAIINPGSVGQPRDGDPRAAYLIFDVDRAMVEMRRVDYAIKTTQKRIVAAGLPEVLGVRLALGRRLGLGTADTARFAE